MHKPPTPKTVRLTVSDVPAGLATGGSALWSDITDSHELDAVQLVQLLEACRTKDRLDEFDEIIHGRGVLELMRFRILGQFDSDDGTHLTVNVKFDNVISTANTTANLMKQLLAALRLPDEVSGRRPQFRGPRGSQKPSVAGGKAAPVSSLERARAAKLS
jgi:hypothetical protein